MAARQVDGNALVVTTDEGEPLFRMEETIEVARATVELSGSVTEEAANYFADELVTLSTVCNSITIDLTNTQVISGKALRALIKTRTALSERPGAQLVLSGLPNALRTELSNNGLIDFLQVED